jgi:hypothetical protein
MIYADPDSAGAVIDFKQTYGSFTSRKWAAPVRGQYFDNVSPVNGRPFCRISRSTQDDVDRAPDACTSLSTRQNYHFKTRRNFWFSPLRSRSIASLILSKLMTSTSQWIP